MPVVIPNVFVGGPGNKAKASEVNANFDALAAKFDAGIVNADVAVGAAIDADKLADASIATAKLESEAVTDAKLASDAIFPGADSGRAVSGPHIKSLLEADLDRILPAAGIGKDKLKLTVQTAGFSITGTPLSNTTTFANLGALGTPVPTASAIILAMYFQNITVTNGGDLKSVWLERITTGANYQVRVYISSSDSAQVTGNVIVVSMDLT